jgi:hypothetical protein
MIFLGHRLYVDCNYVESRRLHRVTAEKAQPGVLVIRHVIC